MGESCNWLQANCGEETSPTPQMDWSLAHGLKTTMGLNFLLRFGRGFFEIVCAGDMHRQQRSYRS